MNERWRPWQRLLPLWLPAVLLCIGSAAVYAWQTSGSLGRAAQLRDRVAELEAKIGRLQQIRFEAAEEGVAVAALDEDVKHVYRDVFSSLEERLTRVLRAVGAATREAGLLPGRFSYSADETKDLYNIRFGVKFEVRGQYAQLRKMLAALQASPEFFIVDKLSFGGEEEAASREIQISVSLATYLAEADPENLRRLIQGPTAEERDDG